MDRLLDRIEQAAENYINNIGYEMVDLSLSKTKNGWILRFLVDKPYGGISIHECAVLNEGLRGLLDKENILGKGYSLEVSSPGVDRVLREKNDFLRASGRKIRVFLSEPIEKKTEIDGIIDEVGDEFLSLKTDGSCPCPAPARRNGACPQGQDESIVKIPFNKIKKARQLTSHLL